MAEALQNNNNNNNIKNWQVKMRTLNDCGKFLFNNVIMSDITFTFNDNDRNEVTRIHAHSWILSMLSPIFYESLKDTFEVTKEIPVSDNKSVDFMESLRFIYTGECFLSDINVFEVIKVAKKYSLKYLEGDCADFIIKSITIDSACPTLDNAITYKYDVMKDKVLSYIAKNIAPIMNTNSFAQIEKETLEAILTIEKVGPITEKEMFNGVMKWAGEKCIRSEMIVNGENKRRILGDLVKDIRFTKTTAVELGQLVKDEKGLLTLEEINDLLISICTKDLNNFGLRNDERKHLIDLNTINEKYIATSDSYHFIWILYKNMREPKERSKFTVNKMIYITKIGTCNSNLSQNVIIQILNEQNVILFEKTTQSKWNASTTFEITPLLIYPIREYIINIKYENTNGGFFCDPQQTLPVTRSEEGIEFRFTELSQLLDEIYYKSID